MKTFVLLIFALLSVAPGKGQALQTGSITGTVAGSGKGVFGATVALRRNADKTTVKFAVTDSVGAFEFTGIAYGWYVVSVTAVGFERRVSDSIGLQAPAITIAAITLEAEATNLEQVTVSTVKPLIEQKIDRTIVNVANSVTMSGNNGAEVLAQLPGVAISAGGKITVKGKEGAVVLINGRLTYLTGGDLSNYLKGMQASQIEKIEIISNPSVKYDAAGSGVINIITKTETRRGWNASLSTAYRQGVYASTTNSLAVNYRTEKVNAGLTMGYQLLNGFQDYYVLRNQRDGADNAIQSIFDQHSYQKTTNKSANARLNIDYYMNAKTVLGLGVSYYDNPTHSTGNNNTVLKLPDGTVQQRVLASTSANGSWRNPAYNVNLKHALNAKGQNIEFDGNYIRYTTNDQQSFDNYFYQQLEEKPDTAELFRARLPRTIKIATGKVDYVLPLGAHDKLEAGVKGSDVRTDNNAMYFNEVASHLVADSAASNHFLYKERVLASYLNYKKQLGKMGVQAGVRVENTASKGSLLTTGEVNKRNYTQWFPSVGLEYKMNESHTLGVSYSRRIERPEYQSLNPFRYYVDKYTFEEGNSFLLPQTADNIELNYLLMGGLLSATASYSRTNNPIQSVVLQNPEKNETYLKPQNLDKREVMGIQLSSVVPLSEKLTSTWNILLNNTRITGVINELPYTLEQFQFYGSVLNQWKFAEGWSAELYGLYSSSSIEDAFVRRPYGTISAGVSKTILNKKGSVRLSGADVFYWNKLVAYSRYQHVDAFLDNRFQTRTIRLAFTYRINSPAKVAAKTLPEETDRVRMK
ncbi:Outer membrane receptor proteins, mostly Fe transport [Filimonas lacunae]|uniref:Outer membrane receptor proteins, mostly Fe transport n=1 Tax=Filimonas lacunae TaxID=477680 RepID=A0A173MEI1_9BACT|nr:outer membrane beta-barrel family protein [Filimonas lacunae]BAV05930.1 TonB-dependent receptor [Filimonas lacunae]SIT23762.1 Outer membrane receptor proteins, mostly Fe transport [Filimonas lacunae]